jgi:tetratricopeptide (TPR) repeat protein
LLCLLVYRTLMQVILYFDVREYAIPVAFLGTILYAVHPVHTEVVANIKGRDELLAVSFGLLTILNFLKYLGNGKIQYIVLSGICLFMGLLSKENALTFLAIAFLISILKFKPYARLQYSMSLLILSGFAGLYFIIRWKVAGGFAGDAVNELMNNPFLYAAENQKYPTILYTLIVYLKLLVYPHPLTYDYYPYHIELQSWTNPLVILSLVFYILFPIIFFYCFRKNKLIAFGTAFFLITLLPVSNLLVNIGAFMNERFLFLPSVGFAIVAGYLLYLSINRDKKQKKATFIELVFLLVVLLFSGMTIDRNQNWKDNFTLFTHDVKISMNSAKGNCTAGGVLLEQGQKQKDKKTKQEYLERSIKYLNTALEIYPDYIDALLLLGNAHYNYNKNYNKVFDNYQKIFVLAPQYDLAFSNLNIMLASEKEPGPRKTGYHLILKYRPDDFDANYQLGSTYGKMLNLFDSAQMYLSKAVQIQPENKVANRDMGVACALTGDYKKSLPYFEEVLEMDPSDPANYINLGITYQNLGNNTKAAELFREAEKLRNREDVN